MSLLSRIPTSTRSERLDEVHRFDNYERRLYSAFRQGLTQRQVHAWINDDKVPKSKVHQLKYRDWQIAVAELNVLKKRLDMHLVWSA